MASQGGNPLVPHPLNKSLLTIYLCHISKNGHAKIKTTNGSQAYKDICRSFVCQLGEKLTLKNDERHKTSKNLNLRYDIPAQKVPQTMPETTWVLLSLSVGIQAIDGYCRGSGDGSKSLETRKAFQLMSESC